MRRAWKDGTLKSTRGSFIRPSARGTSNYLRIFRQLTHPNQVDVWLANNRGESDRFLMHIFMLNTKRFERLQRMFWQDTRRVTISTTSTCYSKYCKNMIRGKLLIYKITVERTRLPNIEKLYSHTFSDVTSWFRNPQTPSLFFKFRFALLAPCVNYLPHTLPSRCFPGQLHCFFSFISYKKR